MVAHAQLCSQKNFKHGVKLTCQGGWRVTFTFRCCKTNGSNNLTCARKMLQDSKDSFLPQPPGSGIRTKSSTSKARVRPSSSTEAGDYEEILVSRARGNVDTLPSGLKPAAASNRNGSRETTALVGMENRFLFDVDKATKALANSGYVMIVKNDVLEPISGNQDRPTVYGWPLTTPLPGSISLGKSGVEPSDGASQLYQCVGSGGVTCVRLGVCDTRSEAASATAPRDRRPQRLGL